MLRKSEKQDVAPARPALDWFRNGLRAMPKLVRMLHVRDLEIESNWNDRGPAFPESRAAIGYHWKREIS
jgi:hypothetical protein